MNAPDLSPRATDGRWHHQHPVRIYWEDTDAGGIVFYGNYLKFMERARTEWLRALGFDQEGMRRSGEGMFVVADTQLRYLQPARLDDLLNVTVAVVERGRASVVFAQEVWRNGILLVSGRIRIGWVQAVVADAADAAEPVLRPGRIPQRILGCLPEPLPANAGTSTDTPAHTPA
ncbi:acyl-CoA thioester hydrolase [Aquabacterium commune]|uniref:Acyl-CoA thioester hydrolase n=1 Tax=Aquabacterium commune TaxID=70586 RepID=A0A4R6RHP6_9BURK|nr:YbgC/FadM family acyl-CoA thioesterase [Aquabacterium commune]TDP85705.1 acyl-CoA thioester hydrolase [Aquabacterium commune]